MVASNMLETGVLKSLKVIENHMDKESKELDKQLGELTLEQVRNRRKAFLKEQSNKNQQYLAMGHGVYQEVIDTKEFFNLCKQSERVVVHFYRGTTRRCEIVDKHLTNLASTHLETRFLKVNVEKNQYLCERLNIFILPSIVIVLDGKTEKTFRGFEEFGNTDDFSTRIMEDKLKEVGALSTVDAESTLLNQLEGKENIKNSVKQSEFCQDSVSSRESDNDEDW